MNALKPNNNDIKTLFMTYKNSDHYKLVRQNIDIHRFEQLLNTVIQSISKFILESETPKFDSFTKRFAITISYDLSKLDIKTTGTNLKHYVTRSVLYTLNKNAEELIPLQEREEKFVKNCENFAKATTESNIAPAEAIKSLNNIAALKCQLPNRYIKNLRRLEEHIMLKNDPIDKCEISVFKPRMLIYTTNLTDPAKLLALHLFPPFSKLMSDCYTFRVLYEKLKHESRYQQVLDTAYEFTSSTVFKTIKLKRKAEANRELKIYDMKRRRYEISVSR